jgi:hypothetical protein
MAKTKKKSARKASKKSTRKAAKKTAKKSAKKPAKKSSKKPAKKYPQRPPKAKTKTNSDRPLTASEQKDIDLSVARGYKQLKLNPETTTPEQAQQAIHEAVDEVFLGKKKLSERALVDMGINLGCLWGQTIAKVMGWEWCYATAHGEEFFAVVSPNRSYALAPMNFIFTQLYKRPPDENNSMLLYNMVVGESLPQSKARAYVTIA